MYLAFGYHPGMAATPETPATPETLPKTVVLVGNPGYPVAMVAAENNFATLTIVHWRADLRPGDKVVIGRDIDTAWTYIVTRNAPRPPHEGGFSARLMRHSLHVGVKGMLV